jgi:hypothetical protein
MVNFLEKKFIGDPNFNFFCENSNGHFFNELNLKLAKKKCSIGWQLITRLGISLIPGDSS